MDYHELLLKTLDGSKLKDAEVHRRCSDNGVPFNDNYISMLRSDKKRTASDEISRAIAIVCGQPEDLLVFQKYYDNAPPEYRQVFDNLREQLAAILTVITASQSDAEKIDAIYNTVNNLSIAELITALSDIDMEKFRAAIDSISPTAALNACQCGYPVQDDAMAPIIPQGAVVFTCAYENWLEYKDGDIFCFHKFGDEAFYIREVQFLNDEHTEFRTLPRNNGYPKEIFKKDADIFLYGKVVQMVVGFD